MIYKAITTLWKIQRNLKEKAKEVNKDNSEIIKREDEDVKDNINDVNNKLKNYCNSAGVNFIDNSNIDGPCLNRGKLHLNRKGIAALA